MDLTQQLMTRCQCRHLADEEGNPTDAGVLALSRLTRFLKPHVFQQSTETGVRVRVEWLGYYEDGEGSDIFKVEHDLLQRLALRVPEEAKKAVVVTKLRKDEKPLF